MIDIDKQIAVLDKLTSQANSENYGMTVLDTLIVREMVLQGFLTDLRDNARVVSVHPSRSFELFGDIDK
jgi:hypothetical protein